MPKKIQRRGGAPGKRGAVALDPDADTKRALVGAPVWMWDRIEKKGRARGLNNRSEVTREAWAVWAAIPAASRRRLLVIAEEGGGSLEALVALAVSELLDPPAAGPSRCVAGAVCLGCKRCEP